MNPRLLRIIDVCAGTYLAEIAAFIGLKVLFNYKLVNCNKYEIVRK